MGTTFPNKEAQKWEYTCEVIEYRSGRGDGWLSSGEIVKQVLGKAIPLEKHLLAISVPLFLTIQMEKHVKQPTPVGQNLNPGGKA